MARTTEALVAAILGSDWDGSRDLDQFIAAATVLVDRVNTCATNKGVTLTSTELELIERWLAAHFLTTTSSPFRPYKSKKTADAAASYQGETGKGLESSFYGQTAMNLDPSGCLESITSRKRALLEWVGKRPSDQIAYEDRD